MFGKMGELKQMYDKYKKLQDALKKIVIRARENGIIIDMSAEQKVIKIDIEDTDLLAPEKKEVIETALKVAFEKAQAKAQEVAMEKTKEILGFDPNDLAWMMWGMWGGGMPKLG
jgi:DNA-binding protein YbaB